MALRRVDRTRGVHTANDSRGIWGARVECQPFLSFVCQQNSACPREAYETRFDCKPNKKGIRGNQRSGTGFVLMLYKINNKYLGVNISTKRGRDKEINIGIAKTNSVIRKLHCVLLNGRRTSSKKQRIFRSAPRKVYRLTNLHGATGNMHYRRRSCKTTRLHRILIKRVDFNHH